MTDCSNIVEATAWPCARRQAFGGHEVLVVTPPVRFWDGSVIPLYLVQYSPESVQLTDDGGILQHLEASGFRLAEEPRRQLGLRRAIENCGMTFTNELSLLCGPATLKVALHKALAAMFAVRHWEAENAGRPIDARLLMSEAEEYLRILRPAATVRHDVLLSGISGRSHVFPLALDTDVFDAVASHPISSAAMTKKLFDVRSVREQRDLPITVVLDDRTESDRVKQDISLLSQLAHVERFTAIRDQALQFVQKH